MEKSQEIDFVAQLTSSQTGLLTFIRQLLGGDWEAAKDVLQETNVFLWTHAQTFDAAKGSFLTWAKTQAYYQVRNYRRDMQRERSRLLFDEELFEAAAAKLLAPVAPEKSDRLLALEHCLGLLSPGDRELVESRYHRNEPFKALATRLFLSEDNLKVKLFRLRKRLGDCVNRQACTLEKGEEP